MFAQRSMPGFLFAWLLLSSIWFQSRPVRADNLDQMSISQLTHFVQSEASSADLGRLAQRQFYFKVNRDHQAMAIDYAQLQEVIAQKIPTEFARPVFDVRFIFGRDANVTNSRTAGILGGTGPLSDAHIISLVMQGIPTEQLLEGTMIHLFSLPPPRTTRDQLLGGVSYAARLTTFLRHGYAEYFLASNTAHLNFKTLERLSGSQRINHLPEIIAARIAAEQNAENVQDTLLILGTKQAWDGRLYDAIFDQRKLPYARIRAEQQVELQVWIDRIKQGQVGPVEAQELKGFVAQLGRLYGATALVLACTELPLGLGNLLQELEVEGFKVYDTEAMIAEIISEKLTHIGAGPLEVQPIR